MIIRNGRVLDPATGFDAVADVQILGGKIAAIGTIEASDDIAWDAQGLVVAPGLVDVHSHFRDPGQTQKEDIFSGAQAAAHGGYTTVVCMANTRPPVDNCETLGYILDRAAAQPIHVLQDACITLGMEGQALVPMEQLLRAGAAGFTDDGIPLLDPQLARAAMQAASCLNTVLSLHEEDPRLIGKPGVNQGLISHQLSHPGAPRISEDVLVARDVMLAVETGARVNFQHLSSKNAVAAVRMGRQLGGDIWAEATPHHFSLTEQAVLEHGAMAKMNPPLRTEEDRQAIIEGLRDGTIAIIATDHAPHTAAEKAKGLLDAPSGIIGLETALSLGIMNLVVPGYLTLSELLAKMTCNPAALYGLDAGRLCVGGPADLVLFDPDEEYRIEEFASKSQNSPFLGVPLRGRVKATICRGSIVYKAQ